MGVERGGGSFEGEEGGRGVGFRAWEGKVEGGRGGEGWVERIVEQEEMGLGVWS